MKKSLAHMMWECKHLMGCAFSMIDPALPRLFGVSLVERLSKDQSNDEGEVKNLLKHVLMELVLVKTGNGEKKFLPGMHLTPIAITL